MKPASEPFLPYRDRIVYALAIATVIGVTPFTINNFIQGRTVMGAIALLFLAILVVDAVAIYRRRAPPIPLWTLALPVLATMAGALLTPHYLALAWAYPTLTLFYFILPRGTANIVAAIMVLLITTLTYGMLDTRLALRLGATLTLNAVLANIFVAIIADLYRRLAEQALTDPLTHAFNRRHMDAVLGDLVERTARGEARPSLVLFDIDHFKEVNDQHGHAAGDAVLLAMAELVRSRVRRIDQLFRSGGEEFVLVLPATELPGASRLAEDIRAAIAAEPILPGRRVTVSAGVSELRSGEAPEAWLRRADESLYEAKRAGRNRIVARSATLRDVLETA